MNRDPYKRIARTYDRLAEPAAGKLRKISLEIYSPRKGSSVLDVGCGTGTQLSLYRAAGCRLSGVDTSPSMLEAARRKLGQAADLRIEDASHMTFPDETFDLVTMVFVLHEMPPSIRSAVLQECRRVVKGDGRVSSVPVKVTLSSFWPPQIR